MKDYALQIQEVYVNKSFEPISNTFEEFQTFSSNLFSQIMDWISLMLQSLPE